MGNFCWDALGGEFHTLSQLGSRVTLIVSSPQILIKEDSEAAFLVQAQLEAQGIRVLTQHPITQVK